jgi:methyl-accepting chemotaxis protein
MDQIMSIFTEIEHEIEQIKQMSSNVSEISKVLLEQNKKINEAVSNTSSICAETVANTENFQEMVDKQEDIFLSLKGSSEHLDQLSATLSAEISKFRIN